jgi:hypothetical protein
VFAALKIGVSVASITVTVEVLVIGTGVIGGDTVEVEVEV